MSGPLRAGRLVPVLALSVVTALWGSTFVISKGALERMAPLELLSWRFALAAGVMVVIRPTALVAVPRRVWRGGVLLGVLYGSAQIPQYIGLTGTTAATSGFLIGTYVVFTPLLGSVFLRTRSPVTTYVGVLLAAAGLGVFSFDGLRLEWGEALSLVAAVLYAGHIVAMGRWSTPGDAWVLTTIQMITIAVVLGIPALTLGLPPPSHPVDWWAILWLAVIAGALAIGVQTWAQSRIPATHAAVIMAAEPLWAAMFAVGVGGEELGVRLLLGGALLLAANLTIAATGRAA